MKTIYLRHALLTGAALLLLSGCNSFLEEYSQDERVPSTLKDYEELLYGEAYFKDVKLPYSYIELLTDDVKANYVKGNKGDDGRVEAFGYFTWQDNPEISTTGTLNNDLTWEQLYHQILTANVVEDRLGGIDATEAEKAKLQGEICAIRTFAYFMLVNLYAEPYTTPEEAKTRPGVPINTHTFGEDTNYPRNTLAEVYDYILANLEAGMTAFAKAETGEPTIFRWNEAALATLGSRICLYLHNWEKAKEYADRSLQLNSYLWDLAEKNAGDPEHEKPFISKENREVNFSYGFYQGTALSTAHVYYFNVSDELLTLYEPGDLRYNEEKGGSFIASTKVQVGTEKKKVWGITITVPIYEYFPAAAKNGPSDETKVFGYAIRSAEAYLNRAEASAMLGDREAALRDLNTLRKARITGEQALLSLPEDGEELIRMVREERRRELCFEHQRWFDLRRWDMPELTHEYITDGEADTREIYTLPQGSPKYTLPIPQEVLLSDPVLAEK